MKVPRDRNMFCRKCKKHTKHTMETAKKRKTRADSMGQRRFKRKMEGYGSFPKPMPTGKKPTQRQDLRYKCAECKLSETRTKTYRVKKFEVTTE
ncbi:MAG: 50S ribosomal protein L44e [archaeon]